LFVVAAPVSFLFPVYTAPLLLAAVAQGYIAEEWIHHSVHYYNFRSPYFRYIKKHHFYHHTSQGMTRGFGTTSGMWDMVFGARFPRASKVSCSSPEAKRNSQHWPPRCAPRMRFKSSLWPSI